MPCWEGGYGVLEYGEREDVEDVRFQGREGCEVGWGWKGGERG